MIYIWVNNIKKMIKYDCFESYWNSFAYEFFKRGSDSFKTVMIEEDTPIWRN